MSEIELLSLIHSDLGYLCCFLIIIILFIILKYTYKFFDMIFKF